MINFISSARIPSEKVPSARKPLAGGGQWSVRHGGYLWLQGSLQSGILLSVLPDVLVTIRPAGLTVDNPGHADERLHLGPHHPPWPVPGGQPYPHPCLHPTFQQSHLSLSRWVASHLSSCMSLLKTISGICSKLNFKYPIYVESNYLIIKLLTAPLV